MPAHIAPSSSRLDPGSRPDLHQHPSSRPLRLHRFLIHRLIRLLDFCLSAFVWVPPLPNFLPLEPVLRK